MKTLYLFRHGETDWNKSNRIQGKTDIPLNDQGIEQAEGLYKKLKDIQFDLVLSSNLLRAYKTQEIAFRDKDVKLVITDKLQEFDFGQYEGHSWDELLKEFGQGVIDKFWGVGDMDFAFGDGEKKSEVRDRALTVIKKYLEDKRYNTIAVSTHGGVLRQLLVHICGGEPGVGRIGNCQCFKVEVTSDKWSLVYIPTF